MAGTPTPDDVLIAAVALNADHPTTAEAARAGGIPYQTLTNRLKVAARRGFMGTAPVLPGFEIERTTTQTVDGKIKSTSVKQRPERGPKFEMPKGLALKGVTALLDGDGHILHQHVMGRAGAVDHLAIAEGIKAAFTKFKPHARRVAGPAATDSQLLTLIPCNDWHVGMSAWGREVDFNWDLKIAERVIGEAIEDVIARSKPSSHAIVLGGGDLLHADNGENKTAKSGNVLDVDGRYQKVIDVACRLMARTVDAALRRHKKVTVRILQGNHDEHACVAVAYFLYAWYRKDRRVTVDVDPSLFFRMQFGLVMLGGTHGHLAKLKDMPGVMAHRWAEMWGATRFRYAHGFHIHHKEKLVSEGGGCICEAHQAPIPQDSWHYGKGFISGRSVQAITYHKKFGEFGRVATPIMDAS